MARTAQTRAVEIVRYFRAVAQDVLTVMSLAIRRIDVRLRNCVFVALLMGCVFAGGCQEADTAATKLVDQKEPSAPPPPVYLLDETAADPDFQKQGEYEGVVGDRKVGVQVIALGKGAFRGVFYPGGPPGAGWDGTGKREIDAKVADGKLIGKTNSGESFELKKVIRQSPTLGAKAPEGAIVLFDSSNVDAWNGGRMNANKLLMVGAKTKQQFKDCTLHLEFCLPFMPDKRGQERANSGVYLQDRYEVQILDSFGLGGLRDECGAIYNVSKPLVNMCFPPLSWQTYDIDFVASKHDAAGRKITDAQITVRHNGVLIQDKVAMRRRTGGHQTDYSLPGSVTLQDHGSLVLFRNIWIVPK